MAEIHVVRVWTYITANEGFAKRTLDYLSFMLSSFLASFFVRKVDVVIGTSPQFFTVCSAFMVSKCKRVPWVFELRDVWPESIRAVGAMRESKVLHALESLEMFLYRKADKIIPVTNSFKQSLVRRGVKEDKIEVVTNGVDLSRFSQIPKETKLVRKLGLENKFVAGYVGTHGMAHALGTILDAARLTKDSKGCEQIVFILLGDGAEKESLVARAKAEKLDNVVFVDSVSKQDVSLYWSLLDVSIIHLKKTELFKKVIPSKLFECMGMGIPILHGVEGESAEIVLRNKVGLLFKPETPKELQEQLQILASQRYLLDKFKQNSLNSAQSYSRQKLASNMLQIVQKTVSSAKN